MKYLQEYREMMGEATVKNEWDSEYNNLIRKFKTIIKWDAPPKTMRSSAVTEITGSKSGKDYTLVLQFPDSKWGAWWNFLALMYETDDSNRINHAFNKSGKQISKINGVPPEKLQSQNISEFYDAIDFIWKLKESVNKESYEYLSEESSFIELNTDVFKIRDSDIHRRVKYIADDLQKKIDSETKRAKEMVLKQLEGFEVSGRSFRKPKEITQIVSFLTDYYGNVSSLQAKLADGKNVMISIRDDMKEST